MPSVSKKQARFMAAAAHNPKFAKKAGIKRSVAKEFNKADAGTGILKKGAGGAIQQVLSRVSQGNRGPIGRAVRGALARVPRPAPPPPKPVDPGEMIRKGSAFRGRNAGPMKNPVTEADNTLAETGEGLRKTIGRIALGRRTGFKEGGKVGAGLTALQQLAKAYKEALNLDDTEKAARLKRQMEKLKPGSTKDIEDPGKAASDEKLATFAEGGRVKKTIKSLRVLQDHLNDADRTTEKSIIRKQEKLQRDLRRRGVEFEGDEDNVGTVTRRPLKNREKFAEGGKVKLFWKVIDKSGKIRSVLEDEDKAWNLSDRINSFGRSETHVVNASEEEAKQFREPKK